MLRRSARLFDKEVTRLNAIEGKTTPRCFPVEIILLIVSMVVEDAQSSANSIRWCVGDDFRGNFRRRGLFKHPNRAEMSLRLLLVRGPLQANKLCRGVVEKTFIRVDISPSDARPDELPMQAFILPNIDVFHEGPQQAFIGRQNGPTWATSVIPQMPTSNQLVSFTPQNIPDQLVGFIPHLAMNPVHFGRVLSYGSKPIQPSGQASGETSGQSLASLKSLEYIVLQSSEVYRTNHKSGRNIRIPHGWRDMRLMERDLGRTFGELWKPYQERGLRIFVSRLPYGRDIDSEFWFELLATTQGGMILRGLQ